MRPYHIENDHIKPHRRANLDYRFKCSWNILLHSYVSHIFLTREQRNHMDTCYSELHTNLHRTVQCWVFLSSLVPLMPQIYIVVLYRIDFAEYFRGQGKNGVILCTLLKKIKLNYDGFLFFSPLHFAEMIAFLVWISKRESENKESIFLEYCRRQQCRNDWLLRICIIL